MALRRVLNKDYDSGEFWVAYEEDDDPRRRFLTQLVAPAPAPVASPRPGVPKRLLTDIEAADHLGTSKSYVRALIANGKLRRVELPSTDGEGRRARLLRIDVKDLDQFIERSKG